MTAQSSAAQHGAGSRDGDVGAGPPDVGRFGIRTPLLLAFVFANFSVWAAFFSPVVILVPTKVRALAPDSYGTTLSVILVISGVFGLVAGPVFGQLSDRSTSRFGRRRAWFAIAMLIGFLGVVAMGLAASVPTFTGGSVLSLIGFGAAVSVLLTILPEHVAPSRRGVVGALLGVSQAIAVVVGVVLTGQLASRPAVAFTAVGAIGLVGTVVLCAVLPDPARSAQGRAPLALTEVLGAFWINPRRHPDFGWAWLSRFCLFFSFAAVVNYQLYYLRDQLGLSEGAANHYVQVATPIQVVSTVVGSLIAGALSDRVGRRKPFVTVAAAIGVVALVLIGLATAPPLYLAGIVLIGLATGAYAAVDLALVTAVLPRGEADAGKDLGVINIANQLPQTLAPATAPLLLAIGFWSIAGDAPGKNYTMLFLGSAVFAVISAVAVNRIRSVR